MTKLRSVASSSLSWFAGGLDVAPGVTFTLLGLARGDLLLRQQHLAYAIDQAIGDLAGINLEITLGDSLTNFGHAYAVDRRGAGEGTSICWSRAERGDSATSDSGAAGRLAIPDLDAGLLAPLTTPPTDFTELSIFTREILSKGSFYTI